MFGIGMGEFLGLVVLGLFLVGPDKLPNAAMILPVSYTKFVISLHTLLEN